MKLMFFDIDGVIYKDKKINDKLLLFLQKNKIPFVFCTGRGYLRSLEVVNNYLNELPIIIENGSKIVTKNNEIIYQKFLTQNEKEILKYIDYKEVEYILFNPSNSNNYIQYGDKPLLYVSKRISNYEDFYNEVLANDICQITIKFKGNEYVNTFIDKCNKNDINAIKSEDYIIINSKGINKRTAIEFIIDNIIMNDDIYIFGNDYNDIEMFRLKKGKKIAIIDDNTPEELISLSDIQTSYKDLYKVVFNIVKYKKN